MPAMPAKNNNEPAKVNENALSLSQSLSQSQSLPASEIEILLQATKRFQHIFNAAATASDKEMSTCWFCGCCPLSAIYLYLVDTFNDAP